MSDPGLESVLDSELAELIISRAKRFASRADNMRHQPLDAAGRFRRLLSAVDEMEERINVPLQAKHQINVRFEEEGDT